MFGAKEVGKPVAVQFVTSAEYNQFILSCLLKGVGNL